MNRVLVAMLPWLWILIGGLHGVSALREFFDGHWVLGLLASFISVSCVLMGLAQRAERKARMQELQRAALEGRP